jgi:hypothetical protein
MQYKVVCLTYNFESTNKLISMPTHASFHVKQKTRYENFILLNPRPPKP